LNFCLALFQRGWTRRAIRWLSALVETIESSLPPDSHLLPIAQSELAIMQLKLGDGSAAIQSFQLAQTNYERTFGPQHHNSIQNKGFLASALINQGDLVKARAILQEVLAILPPQGYDAGWRIGFEYNFAVTFLEAHDLETATRLLDELLPRAIATHGRGDDITRRIGDALVQSYLELKRFTDFMRVMRLMQNH
jgi:tetratricopeptide (TPR) repeat protein